MFCSPFIFLLRKTLSSEKKITFSKKIKTKRGHIAEMEVVE
jgi:hypothetical protein